RVQGDGGGDGGRGAGDPRPGGEPGRRPGRYRMKTATEAIRFAGVNKWFGKLHVLRNIDLSVATGEVVVVCGPSGSGKSTLIRTVNGLERVQEGDITVLGDSITRR